MHSDHLPQSMDVLGQDMETLRLHRLLNLGSLSAGVAHDLNNLLTGINSFATLLDKDLSPSERKTYLDLIRRTVLRASRLTGSILSYLKEEESVAIPIDPLSCVRDMVSLLQETIRDDISVQLQLPNKSHAVLIQRSDLSQLVLNLLINARDAIEGAGSITVKGSFEPQPRPQSFVLSISDSGVGIPEQDLAQIFRPFFSRKQREDAGTGLGLAIVKQIVSEAGGQITVESSLGRPTCFTVELPTTCRYSQRQVVEEVPGGNECVLIQQCGSADSYPLYELLMHKGYDSFMVTAEDGIEDLGAYLPTPPKLLVIDVMESLEVAWGAFGRLRESFPDSRVLITLSHLSCTDIPLPPGVDILQKPFESHEFWKSVRQLLDSRLV